MSQPVLKVAAGVAALVAIAFGASAIAGGSNSGSSAGQPGGGPLAGGRMRPGGPPGGPRFGKPVTGATAAKVKAAALAKYPGRVEQVVALPGGGYVAHVFTTGGGEVHVLVNSRFQVTGTATRPPGAPGGGAAPQPGSSF